MKQGNSMTDKCFFGVLLILSFSMSACTVVKVVDAAASTAVGVTVGTVKATGKVLGAAIPDGDNDDEHE